MPIPRPRQGSGARWGSPIPILTIASATDIDVMALKGALEPVHNDEELEKSVEQTRIIAGAVSVVAEVWTDSLTKAAEEMANAGVRADDVALRLRDLLELERLSFLLDYLHRRQLIAASNGASTGVQTARCQIRCSQSVSPTSLVTPR